MTAGIEKTDKPCPYISSLIPLGMGTLGYPQDCRLLNLDGGRLELALAYAGEVGDGSDYDQA